MSDDSETVEDMEKGSLAEVTDDSCTVEFIEIVPLDRASDDYDKLEFVDPVVDVKPGDLLDVKQEPADEIDNEHTNFSIKQEPTDEYCDGDPNYSVKQEPADEYETGASCSTIQVSSVCTQSDFSRSTPMICLHTAAPKVKEM